MYSYTETIREFFDVRLRETDYGVVVTTDIFFSGSDESIALFFSQSDGGYVVDDCHSVTDYWEYSYISPEEHRERIDKITESFGLSFDGTRFSKKSLDDSEWSLRHLIGSFLQAVSLLGNINI